MARKPVSVRAGSSFNDARESAWAAMRKLKQFTLEDLEVESRENSRTIATYLQALIKGEYVQMVGHDIRGIHTKGIVKNKTMNKPGIYRLIRNVGVEAPRLKRDGTLVTQGRGRKNMWRAMKVLSNFNWLDLSLQASVDDVAVSQNEAKDYVKHLYKAGYLQLVQKSKPGTAARYRLKRGRFTGPKAPKIQRVKHVYDPNLRKVVWPTGVEQ